MDRTTLAARIQEIMKSRPQTEGMGAAEPRLSQGDEEAAFAARCEEDAATASVTDVLGGQLLAGPGGQCVVVDRCFEGCRKHGREPVARYAEAMGACRGALDLLLPGKLDGPPPMFFDLETTSLSGGAGTYAFLVGCGWFEGDCFRTRQFFLRGFAEERALLHAVTSFIRGFRQAASEPLPAACCQLPAHWMYVNRAA